MDDIKGFLKQYWPYVLGGVIGIWLISRFMRGGSASSDGGAGAFYTAQAQAGAQNAALQLQAQMQQAQIDAQNLQSGREFEIAKGQLELQTNVAAANAQTAFLTSQAQMAQSVGSAAATTIGALYQPTVAAIQTAGYENAAALTAAANVAAAGFVTQGGIVQATSDTVGHVANAINTWGDIAAGIGGIMAQQRPGYVKTISNDAAKVGQAYFSGGMSSWGSGG